MYLIVSIALFLASPLIAVGFLAHLVWVALGIGWGWCEDWLDRL
jgi:hypothetical protein